MLAESGFLYVVCKAQLSDDQTVPMSATTPDTPLYVPLLVTHLSNAPQSAIKINTVLLLTAASLKCVISNTNDSLTASDWVTRLPCDTDVCIAYGNEWHCHLGFFRRLSVLFTVPCVHNTKWLPAISLLGSSLELLFRESNLSICSGTEKDLWSVAWLCKQMYPGY